MLTPPPARSHDRRHRILRLFSQSREQTAARGSLCYNRNPCLKKFFSARLSAAAVPSSAVKFRGRTLRAGRNDQRAPGNRLPLSHFCTQLHHQRPAARQTGNQGGRPRRGRRLLATARHQGVVSGKTASVSSTRRPRTGTSPSPSTSATAQLNDVQSSPPSTSTASPTAARPTPPAPSSSNSRPCRSPSARTPPRSTSARHPRSPRRSPRRCGVHQGRLQHRDHYLARHRQATLRGETANAHRRGWRNPHARPHPQQGKSACSTPTTPTSPAIPQPLASTRNSGSPPPHPAGRAGAQPTLPPRGSNQVHHRILFIDLENTNREADGNAVLVRCSTGHWRGLDQRAASRSRARRASSSRCPKPHGRAGPRLACLRKRSHPQTHESGDEKLAEESPTGCKSPSDRWRAGMIGRRNQVTSAVAATSAED